MDKISSQTEIEIIIGIVAPLGTNRSNFLEKLEESFNNKGYHVEKISLTREFFEISCEYSESFKYYYKMQLCNNIREKISKGFFACMGSHIISKKRALLNKSNNKNVVYILDQIKNITESDILSHTYGLNYVQISLFSNEIERDKELKNKFSNDCNKFDNISLKIDPKNKYKNIFNEEVKTHINSLTNQIKKSFENEVLPDVTHNLMKKDFEEIITFKKENKNYGQQISKLFHRSHYYFNLDLPREQIDIELKKFVKQLLGSYDEYPSQDEFGMNLAYQVSVRSNFPGERHVGAAIISNLGEVLSVASIRAPSKSSNTLLSDQLKINEGYYLYKTKIEKWISQLEELNNSSNLNTNFNEIIRFIDDTLEFHPCTHAEIAAIIDAAKVGTSIRDSTLYTTTFPCHLCAKEIINSGIKRVVYLEAYPKSKNKELYPNLVDFDPKNKSSLIPFDFYHGIGPKRFIYAYSLKNKNNKDNLPPLIRYENPRYYTEKEKDILNYLLCKLNKDSRTNLNFLSKLFGDDTYQ